MLLRIFVLLILSMNLYSQNSDYKSSIRKVSTTVVGFRNIQIKKEKVNGQIREIWLRSDNDSINKPLPMVDTTIVGTGFWVRDNEMFYLITAEHVINLLNENTEVIVSDKNKRPEIGIIWSEKEYLNGLLWNVKNNFDTNGNPQDKGTLMNGNGTLKIYDEDNKLVRVIEYKNGIEVTTENNTPSVKQQKAH